MTEYIEKLTLLITLSDLNVPTLQTWHVPKLSLKSVQYLMMQKAQETLH